MCFHFIFSCAFTFLNHIILDNYFFLLLYCLLFLGVVFHQNRKGEVAAVAISQLISC